MKVIFTERAEKDYKNLERRVKNKVNEVVHALSQSAFPRPYDIKKIKGRKHVYRIRLGDYRIVYYVDVEQGAIAVLKIDKRSRVYKRL